VLRWVARLAITAPRRIVAVAAMGMVVVGIFGVPVAKHLSAGGLQDPNSESAKATQLLTEKFG
jgi:RND superfamily putative drug exporter